MKLNYLNSNRWTFASIDIIFEHLAYPINVYIRVWNQNEHKELFFSNEDFNIQQ